MQSPRCWKNRNKNIHCQAAQRRRAAFELLHSITAKMFSIIIRICKYFFFLPIPAARDGQRGVPGMPGSPVRLHPAAAGPLGEPQPNDFTSSGTSQRLNYANKNTNR